MYEQVSAYVKKYHMLEKEDKVIAGVSGGADSVCLLFMLQMLQKEMGFELLAVHVNHGIRGAAADEDEAYVKTLCEELSVPLKVYHENVPDYAKSHALTEEEAGREVRRKAFLEAARAENGTKIALGHHVEDNVETLLLNLCRGTDVKGLAGMQPVSGMFIRPLLCVKRKEIEDYLEEQGIAYCQDETNDSDAYTRNRIRHQVIPYLTENVNHQAVDHMEQTMEQMRRISDFVQEETDRYYALCVCEPEEGGLLILKEAYEKVPEALRSYVVHRAICQAKGKEKDITSAHVKMLIELMGGQVGRKVDLPDGLLARRVYEGILFVPDGKRGNNKGPDSAKELFTMRRFDKPEEVVTFPRNRYTKWFDYDIIKGAVEIRHRQPGDYLTIDKNGQTQKLKTFFINEKIPQEERDRIWLAADGNHIMWVVGYRQNQAYQITEQTRHILEISYDKGETDERKDRCIDSGGRSECKDKGAGQEDQ